MIPVYNAGAIKEWWPVSGLCIVRAEGHGGPLSMEQRRVTLESVHSE